MTRTILRERAIRGRWGRRRGSGADPVEEDIAPFLPDEPDKPDATPDVTSLATLTSTTTDTDTRAPEADARPLPAPVTPPAAPTRPHPPSDEVPFVTFYQTASPGSPPAGFGTHPHGDDGPVAAGDGETWQSLPRVPSQGWPRAGEVTAAPVAAPVAASTASAAAAAALVAEPAVALAAARPVATLPGPLSQRFPPVPRPAQRTPVPVTSTSGPASELPPPLASAAPALPVIATAASDSRALPPAASDPATQDELAAFRDEVTLASAALHALLADHRAELSTLSADLIELRSTVAELRTQTTRATQHERVSAAPQVTPAELSSAPKPGEAPEPVVPATLMAAVVAAEPDEAPTVATTVEPAALTSTAVPAAVATTAVPEASAGDNEPAASQPAAEEVARRLAKLEIHAAAAVTSAAARIGLPPAHVEVLKQWIGHGGRGIIEVAHAGGRHRVGLAAIVYAVSTGRQVLVVVPNRDSADSWRASLATHAPEVAVLIDEGRRRDVDGPTPNVVLSTASTTARRITAGFEPAALLVAIDADRFGTALLAKALDERCEWRLGLSESFRSGGRRLARYADAYFGGTVLTIS